MKYVRYMVLAGAVAVMAAGTALAQDLSNVSLSLIPVQTAFVKGDVAKFRAMNWTKDSSQSGVKDATLDATLGKDVKVSFEGNGMPGDVDYKGNVVISKEGVGFIKTDYQTFRKYYDGTGGYFPYDHLSVNTLDKDLSLDIGHLGLEIGRGTPEDSPLSFLWERDTKNGDKSRLTWGAVKDRILGGGLAYITTGNSRANKLISPSWESLEETTDKLTLKGKTQVMGFEVKGSGSYEFAKLNTRRYEYWLYNSSAPNYTAADTKQRQVDDAIQTKVLSTTLLANRWLLNDKTYVGLGYNFSHTRNTQVQFETEYSALGVWTGTYSRPKNYSGDALATRDTNTWTAHLLTNITPTLVFVSKAKLELVALHASSEQFGYAAATPPFVSSDTGYRDEQRESNTAQAFSLRYSGLPKTSVYAELELAQNHANRSLQSSSFYEYVEKSPELVGTVGARFAPMRAVSLTTEYKHTVKHTKTNDHLTTDGTFIANMITSKDDASVRLGWKPLKWLENGFRVSQAATQYQTQVYAQDYLKAQGTERNFSYDVTLSPIDILMFNLSYGLQLLKSSTPEANSPLGAQLAPFTGNVWTGSFSTSFMPKEFFTVTNTLSYSRAKNANNNYDVTSTGPAMSYGADDEWYSSDLGVKWSLKKDWSVEPHYAYYGFRSYQGISSGNYSANVLWLDISKKW